MTFSGARLIRTTRPGCAEVPSRPVAPFARRLCAVVVVFRSFQDLAAIRADHRRVPPQTRGAGGQMVSAIGTDDLDVGLVVTRMIACHQTGLAGSVSNPTLAQSRVFTLLAKSLKIAKHGGISAGDRISMEAECGHAARQRSACSVGVSGSEGASMKSNDLAAYRHGCRYGAPQGWQRAYSGAGGASWRALARPRDVQARLCHDCHDGRSRFLLANPHDCRGGGPFLGLMR